ncbi:PREDICTED: uncharacterized protein LOC104726067 isoform X2 [Camelina sativa]|uniref:Uncharacterized protein LOC104726067 isoform X2 n=1 Tax=Camelina sativa TaxID=90675 RepID=A0ABM0UM24_CAMSA|nr:PREDICTED: uncharacterized protein LOC104726067 isoform X2 [Camelina sativa]
MLVSRVLSRVSRSAGLRSSLSSSVATQTRNQYPIVSSRFHSLVHRNPNQLVAVPVSLLNHATPDFNVLQRFGFFSSSSAEPKGNGSNIDVPKTGKASEDVEAGRVTDSETDFESLSRDDLVKLVGEKEHLLKVQREDMMEMKDGFLRSYAELQNLMDRTKRNAESSKKFAVQNFATSLLFVADILEKASSVGKQSFSEIDISKDSAGAAPLLKNLLHGVEMTEKELAQVFKKYGLVKEVPLNEPFDPNRHNAVFQVPDASKPEGTIAEVLKVLNYKRVWILLVRSSYKTS